MTIEKEKAQIIIHKFSQNSNSITNLEIQDLTHYLKVNQFNVKDASNQNNNYAQLHLTQALESEIQKQLKKILSDPNQIGEFLKGCIVSEDRERSQLIVELYKETYKNHDELDKQLYTIILQIEQAETRRKYISFITSTFMVTAGQVEKLQLLQKPAQSKITGWIEWGKQLLDVPLTSFQQQQKQPYPSAPPPSFKNSTVNEEQQQLYPDLPPLQFSFNNLNMSKMQQQPYPSAPPPSFKNSTVNEEQQQQRTQPFKKEDTKNNFLDKQGIFQHQQQDLTVLAMGNQDLVRNLPDQKTICSGSMDPINISLVKDQHDLKAVRAVIIFIIAKASFTIGGSLSSKMKEAKEKGIPVILVAREDEQDIFKSMKIVNASLIISSKNTNNINDEEWGKIADILVDNSKNLKFNA